MMWYVSVNPSVPLRKSSLPCLDTATLAPGMVRSRMKVVMTLSNDRSSSSPSPVIELDIAPGKNKNTSEETYPLRSSGPN